MRKKKREKNFKDFGEWLYELRKQSDFTEQQLAEKIDMINVQEINIKKWERDLEYPDLNIIYKLSEIYQISSTELLHSKEETLKYGIEGIHKYIIKWISLFMGISIYGTIWFCRIVLVLAVILAWVWFYFKTLPARM